MKKVLLLATPLMLLAACGDLSDYPTAACSSRGELGCECGPQNTCKRGADGVRLACTDGLCQVPTCSSDRPGGAGCACEGDKVCAEGHVCAGGRCEVDTGQTLTPPADPVCYTPCRGDLRKADGSVLRCSKDGLLEGCIDGALCRQGTCVMPVDTTRESGELRAGLGSKGGSCAADADCPDFQSCIAGSCYSDCSADSDCRDGRSCYRHACRIPCSTSRDRCPAETVCTTLDGEAGFCMPLASSPAGGAAPVATGTFRLSARSLELTSQKTAHAFRIENVGDQYEEFVVRKVKHREFSDAGPKTILENPLFWLELAAGSDQPERLQELTVGVGPGESKEIRLSGADNPTLDRWEGILEVTSASMGVKELSVAFARSPDGQWTGTMYYVANFPDDGLDAWVRNKSDRAALRAVGNAFIRRWGALRDRRISLREFNAALIAMQTESWKWDSVRQRCPSAANPDPNVGCYLYENNDGIAIFSDYLPDAPVPTGVAELPIVLNVRGDEASSKKWEGKIVSSETLHLAGDPHVSLSFSADPNSCSTSAGGTCLNFLDGFSAEVLVGGRYATDASDRSCSRAVSGTFELTRMPSLLPGFEEGTTEDPVTGKRYRYECRDKLLPYGNGANALNRSMAASNPIPDGATRRRSLELVDGAMIDQSTLLVLFRERLPSFLDPMDAEGFSSYGYIVLTRASQAHLTSSDFEGSTTKDYRARPESEGLSCSPELVDRVLAGFGGGSLSAATASAMGIGVVDGLVPTGDTVVPLDPASAEKVHYYCADTGYFDGGPNDDGRASGELVPCPAESRVEYFTLKGQQGEQAAMAGLGCQKSSGICRAGEPCERAGGVPGQVSPLKGSCADTLAIWKSAGTHDIRVDPVYRCKDPNELVCSKDRTDLRKGKLFYPEAVETSVVFRPLDEDITEAFRYKTRFRNRVGTSVGFAPQVCVGDAIPYCYDPAAIEQIRDRVDCATHVYTRYYDDLSDEARAKLKEFLVRNFSYSEEVVFGLLTPIVHDGFERLNAELLIMMGDEAFTSAFSSRFDLAGQKLANFEGELFEPNGISLSGGAGFQMYSLYQATQYYQAALDRFYGQSKEIWSSIGDLPPGQGFITLATTVSYFDRLIRASSQKTRVWSEIAKQYQGFNRPDLARLVVERAYGQAYMESTILSQMMRKVSRSADSSATAQITKAVELAQHTYRAALLDMRTVYRDISDEATFYGIPPDYIPFPALDPNDTNAFAKSLARAREMARVAADKEQRALADTRSFDTDSALFQAELGRIRDEAEDTLAEICGTFTVQEDGKTSVYTAIPKYAHLSEKTRLLGDPCGLMGNGELNDAILGLEQARLEFEGLKLAHRNLLASAKDAQDQASEQCKRIEDFRDYMADKDGEILRYQDGINSLQLIIDTTSNALGIASTVATLTKCSVGTATDCPTAALSLGAYMGVSIAGNVLMAVNGAIIVGLERRIGDLELAKMKREINEECTAANIDTKYVVKDLMRQAAELELEVAKFQYDLKLAFSRIEKLRNDATSTMAGQAENEEMAINVEAARNDPNVRIYRNDAVSAADRTFFAALKEAYRATKVFEYYTSQSYAALDKLFLIRMVASGDTTLEAYLDELDQAFVQFQESYGNPDTRVAIVSLRDDVLRIPRLDENGIALSEAARTRLLREKLQDVKLLDDRGYLSMAFSTSFDELSPLTRNHKLRFVEVEVVGDDVGDSLGRIYLTQRGTGVVRAVDSRTNYYSFPTRTAVLNPFFNGTRPLSPEVYKSERLRDRPYINTGWDLVFNQKDEKVNKDINLASLADIRLYVYYTDFTEL
ncbi:EB domain-containing protein [Vulgatibacter incomptus]|uniref:Uncharacterized protein n=1 Tax=Vulgatibacter incomptus TaxID=1391653 RepID=A0A0K1PF92_9BACT|nr:EB domain-containing protein [Vulgatibacter incomptus]AKU92177.1 hypothetical protein AKJ08_2564 [Vulgatibacter incomptus]